MNGCRLSEAAELTPNVLYWVLMAPLDPGHPYLTERVGERRLEFE
jgi:hypothetical protein